MFVCSALIPLCLAAAHAVVGTATVNGHVIQVVSQDGDYLYVPFEADQAALFSHPAIGEGTVALAAHDFLAGKYFVALAPGDVVIYNGQMYTVTSREVYAEVGSQAFMDIYGPEDRLVLQTCVEGGYLFVIGYPVETWRAWLPGVWVSKVMIDESKL